MDAGRSGRRTFLRRTAALAAGALAWPRTLDALGDRLGRYAPAQEEFWRVVRQAFVIPADRIYLNVGTLGPQPRVVLDAVEEHARRVAMTRPPVLDWDGLKERLAAFIRCDPAGLAFPRNTTEGMSFVANGLDWTRGDEILTTDHEHIGGLCCWQLVTRRYGLTLRQLPLPAMPDSAEELVRIVRQAISGRTRLVSVSHVNFTNGTIMPVREIVQVCRERGVIAVVDGAHPPGLMRVDLGVIDADFYASSPHKWLLAPQGTGFLWMREGWRTRLWPSVASGGWDDASLGAHRFNHLGTFDESRLAGLDAALRFQEVIGVDRIAERVGYLREMLFDQLSGDSRVQFRSSRDPRLGAGMVSFMVDGVAALDMQASLAASNVRTRVISEYDLGWMRLSPHIHNSVEEMERVAALIRERR